MAQASDSGAFPFAVERELVGICKASMVRLQSQLSQYIQQVHNAHCHNHTQPLLYTALHELYGNEAAEKPTSDTSQSASAYQASDAPTVRPGPVVDAATDVPIPIDNGGIEMSLAPSQPDESPDVKPAIMQTYDPIGLECAQQAMSDSAEAEASHQTTYNEEPPAWATVAEHNRAAAEFPYNNLVFPAQPRPFASTSFYSTPLSVQTAKKIKWRLKMPPLSTQPGRRHQQYKCALCLTTFGLNTNLLRHMRTVHALADKIYRCAESGCSYKTARSDQLKQHYITRHPNNQPLNYSQMFTYASPTGTGARVQPDHSAT